MTGAIVVAIVLLVVLGGIALLSAARRRDNGLATGQLSRETLRRDRSARRSEPVAEPVAAAASGRELERSVVAERSGVPAPAGDRAPAAWSAPDTLAVGVARRQFLNRSAVGLMGFGVTTFAASAFTAFLWPSGAGGFGGKIRLGKVADLKADIAKGGGFLYKPEARAWVTEYPTTGLEKARAVYAAPVLKGMEVGLVALYQKCPHLGCRVPSCVSSQWFECPCHGSQYNRVGEKKGGPAPRGMDRFGVVEASETGDFIIDTSSGMIFQGPAIGTNTTGQEAEGPHCIGAAGGGHH